MFSTSGLTLDAHFCQGHFKRANLFGKAKTCAEVQSCAKSCSSKKMLSSCSSDGDHSNCCKNHAIELDMDYDFSWTILHNSQTNDNHAIYPITKEYSYSDTPLNKSEYLNYKPPLITQREILILHQIWLL